MFVFFFRFSFANSNVTCGELIGYVKARNLLHKYGYLLFVANSKYYLKKRSPRIICDISIYN